MQGGVTSATRPDNRPNSDRFSKRRSYALDYGLRWGIVIIQAQQNFNTFRAIAFFDQGGDGLKQSLRTAARGQQNRNQLPFVLKRW